MITFSLTQINIIVIIFTLSFLIQFLLYRKFFIGFFEPLLLFIVQESLVLASLNYYNITINYICIVLISQIFFYFGFFVAQFNTDFKKLKFFNYSIPESQTLFKVFIDISMIIYLTGNIYKWVLRGITLLSTNVSASKWDSYAGMGIIRRINLGIGGYMLCGIFILFFVTRKKKYLIYIFLQMLVTFFDGSKAAFLIHVFILSILVVHSDEFKMLNKKKLKKCLVPMAVFALIPILYILYKDNGQIFYPVLERLVGEGEGLAYLNMDVVQESISSYGIKDYLVYIFSPILGMFRLVPYVDPLGKELLNIYLNTINIQQNALVGPNTRYFIEGNIYFGTIPGFIYSAFIGFIFSNIHKLFKNKKPQSYFAYCFYMFLFVNLGSLPLDTSGYISIIFNFVLFAIPILFVSLFVTHRFLYCTKEYTHVSS